MCLNPFIAGNSWSLCDNVAAIFLSYLFTEHIKSKHRRGQYIWLWYIIDGKINRFNGVNQPVNIKCQGD